MPQMSARAEKQLRFMMHCLLGHIGSEHVGVGTAANGCRFVMADVEGIGPCRLMMQSTKKGSAFAQAAKNGHQIAWLMSTQGRGYLGPVLHVVGKEVRITTGPALKADLAGAQCHT